MNFWEVEIPGVRGGLLRGARRLPADLAAVTRSRRARIAELTLEKGEVLLRGVGTLRYLLILSENSACQAPICAGAA